MDDFLQELRGWREIPGRKISDDARRMMWLMVKAADEIERLREIIRKHGLMQEGMPPR